MMILEDDVRAMVRLVADVAALGSDHATAKSRLMDGLKVLIGADCWVWALGYLDPERVPVYTSLTHGGFSPERFARYLQAIEHPDMKTLTAPFAAELSSAVGQVTRLRQEIEDAGGNRFAGTDVYPLWLAADVAPLILSARPLNQNCVSMIGIYRRASETLFEEREKQIAHVLLTEVSWLHALGWPENFGVMPPALSQRPRQVLNLLLEGHGRKFIAAEMGISIHTVSGYIKEIYAAFGVQSHAGLMKRFSSVETTNRRHASRRENPLSAFRQAV